MPLSDLLRSLDADAARELEATLAEQQAAADQVVADAERRAAALIAETTAAARAEAEEEARRRLAEATAAARRRIREATEAELDALLGELRDRLAGLPGTPTGREATRALLAEALEVLPSADRIRVHPRHVADVGEQAGGRPVEGDLAELGAVVADSAGRSVVNTVDVRLAALWKRSRAGLVRSWEAG